MLRKNGKGGGGAGSQDKWEAGGPLTLLRGNHHFFVRGVVGKASRKEKGRKHSLERGNKISAPGKKHASQVMRSRKRGTARFLGRGSGPPWIKRRERKEGHAV